MKFRYLLFIFILILGSNRLYSTEKRAEEIISYQQIAKLWAEVTESEKTGTEYQKEIINKLILEFDKRFIKSTNKINSQFSKCEIDYDNTVELSNNYKLIEKTLNSSLYIVLTDLLVEIRKVLRPSA